MIWFARKREHARTRATDGFIYFYLWSRPVVPLTCTCLIGIFLIHQCGSHFFCSWGSWILEVEAKLHPVCVFLILKFCAADTSCTTRSYWLVYPSHVLYFSLRHLISRNADCKVCLWYGGCITSVSNPRWMQICLLFWRNRTEFFDEQKTIEIWLVVWNMFFRGVETTNQIIRARPAKKSNSWSQLEEVQSWSN